MWISIFKRLAVRTALMHDIFIGRRMRVCGFHDEEGFQYIRFCEQGQYEMDYVPNRLRIVVFDFIG